MKRALRLVAILAGIAAISGCQRSEPPQSPELIAPEDGAVFETEPPTFIWSSDALAEDYVIRIYMGSSTDIQDTLSDTTYAMSKTLFETLLNGIYNWAAAAMSEDGESFWSESRSFVIEKPEEPQSLDLDTTYFPLGLGYEWCFERHNWGHYDFEEWDSYDTFTVSVIDSTWSSNSDTLLLDLDQDCWHRFFDFPCAPIVILGNKIRVKGGYVPITPPDTSWTDGIGWIEIGYNGDTLHYYAIWEPYYEEFEDFSVKRIKGIGAVLQSSDYWGKEWYSDHIADRLLYFYNRQDTVWP